MSGIIRDIKEKLSTSNTSQGQSTGASNTSPQQGGQDSQNFNILPHPAVRLFGLFLCYFAHHPIIKKSNDPADLQRETGGGLQSSQGAFSAFTSAPGPVVPNQEMLNNIAPAKVQFTRYPMFYD